MQSTHVKVTRQLRSKPRRVNPVTFVCAARDFAQFEPHLALFQRQFLAANGIIKVVPNVPFQKLLSNISDQHIHVQRNMIMGRRCNSLTIIVNLNPFPRKSTVDLTFATTVSIVQSNNESTSSPKGDHSQVPDEWRNIISNPDYHASYREYFIRMLELFKSIWNGRLNHMTTTTNGLELDPPVTSSIKYVPYRALEKMK